MNQESSFTPFLSDIVTSDDLATRINEVTELNRLLYLVDTKSFTQRIADKVSPGLFKIILTLDQQKQLPTATSQLEDFFIALRSFLSKLPRMTLTIAFEPTESFIQSLADWFGKNLAGKTVLEILVKREIIAGVVIEYNGKYKDYSCAGQVEEGLKQILSTNI